ncbi:FBOX domain containing protein [Pyrenophora tritici-repentis]|uniref:Uncharacterized protein n=1 Tax=Pyrenophora tritici-repentis TaxID=45151 RepID=A0A2W1ENE3_9PLEO|nr:hypothetical protein PtrV1_06796 [Pyrenophora tritici-repentis]KAF7447845.1 hypothetical protein A1F99_072090 [Pyrenophora tritici-repentis]KAF7571546.1 hypothetical protein PtrM4_090460 [Pyrenophora tritici-repentis]KAG9385228.1 hypothetical protein A1F94_004775 [Pyrenophora tritici-repentis]KAI0580484.1 hypothetical protein Alg215_05204 [Pyrenophora tritici-repentis]
MTEPQDVSMESITYMHEDLKNFIVDKLLDHMLPISALTEPAPQDRVVGSLPVLPIELLVMILDSLTITDVMRFRRSNRFAIA